MRNRVNAAAVMFTACLLPPPVLAQLASTEPRSIPDIAGHWELEKVTFPQAGVKPRAGMPVESIDITLTPAELRIEGPRGFFEGTPPMETYKRDGSKFTYVQNFGDWWRKSETWVEWEGGTLLLRLRTRAGWYRADSPDEEQLTRPHGDLFRRVTYENDRLTVRTEALSDDDPPDRENPTSTQIFARTP